MTGGVAQPPPADRPASQHVPYLPPVDATTAPFWDATRERVLLLQSCPACGGTQFPPRAVCVHCGADDPLWTPARGHGTVDAWTVVHRAPRPGFTPPYVVARVRLAEGPVVLANLVGEPAGGWRCEAAVRLDWWPLPDGRHLPVYVPSED